MRYGIYDTAANAWLGDDAGPKLFADLLTARIAAQVWETQVEGTDLGAKFQAREFHAQGLRKTGEHNTRMDALAALRRVEGD